MELQDKIDSINKNLIDHPSFRDEFRKLIDNDYDMTISNNGTLITFTKDEKKDLATKLDTVEISSVDDNLKIVHSTGILHEGNNYRETHKDKEFDKATSFLDTIYECDYYDNNGIQMSHIDTSKSGWGLSNVDYKNIDILNEQLNLVGEHKPDFNNINTFIEPRCINNSSYYSKTLRDGAALATTQECFHTEGKSVYTNYIDMINTEWPNKLNVIPIAKRNNETGNYDLTGYYASSDQSLDEIKKMYENSFIDNLEYSKLNDPNYNIENREELIQSLKDLAKKSIEKTK